MSKETVAGIARAIAEAKGARKFRAQQETNTRQAEDRRQEVEHQALIARNEARLRATGVVGIFCELRDSGVLHLNEHPQFDLKTTWYGGTKEVKVRDYTPASVKWKDDRSGIEMRFDEVAGHDVGRGENIDIVGGSISILRAAISENGELRIGIGTGYGGFKDHIMKTGEKLEEVVKNSILILKAVQE